MAPILIYPPVRAQRSRRPPCAHNNCAGRPTKVRTAPLFPWAAVSMPPRCPDEAIRPMFVPQLQPGLCEPATRTGWATPEKKTPVSFAASWRPWQQRPTGLPMGLAHACACGDGHTHTRAHTGSRRGRRQDAAVTGSVKMYYSLWTRLLVMPVVAFTPVRDRSYLAPMSVE